MPSCFYLHLSSLEHFESGISHFLSKDNSLLASILARDLDFLDFLSFLMQTFTSITFSLLSFCYRGLIIHCFYSLLQFRSDINHFFGMFQS